MQMPVTRIEHFLQLPYSLTLGILILNQVEYELKSLNMMHEKGAKPLSGFCAEEI